MATNRNHQPVVPSDDATSVNDEVRHMVSLASGLLEGIQRECDENGCITLEKTLQYGMATAGLVLNRVLRNSEDMMFNTHVRQSVLSVFSAANAYVENAGIKYQIVPVGYWLGTHEAPDIT